MLEKTTDILYKMLEDCILCPRQCHVNRKEGESGYCKAGFHMKVAKVIPHFGEEPPLSGSKGSGTIFFSHCNLRCRFCQNYQISQLGKGDEMTPQELSEKMLSLQETGCHNISLVTPTPYLPQAMRAVWLAKASGLKVPIVYNTNGYERIDILRLLEGAVDVYLPDAKYGSNEASSFSSHVDDYVKFNIPALKEMKRQVGNLVLNGSGVAEKGFIVRHLVLPNNTADSFSLLRVLGDELGTEIHISLMGQYFPRYKATGTKELNRRLTDEEFEGYCRFLESMGFENGWIQYPDGVDGDFLPDFEIKDGWN